MGYRVSTSTNIIYGETKILTLNTRFKFLSCKFLLRSLANNELINNIVEINNLIEHYVSIMKSLLAGSYEAVMPYETLIYRTPMPKFYQVEYKSQLNKL